jgi:uncharacterized RmlC-like cupin family protein
VKWSPALTARGMTRSIARRRSKSAAKLTDARQSRANVLGYVVRGRLRFEFGPGGAESTEVEEGGFFHVPVGLVHRDVNPLDEPQEFVIAFVGEGPLVVNLDGPQPA